MSGLDAVPGDAESVAAAIGRLIGRGAQVIVAMDGAAAADRVARVLAENGVGLARRDVLAGRESIVAAPSASTTASSYPTSGSPSSASGRSPGGAGPTAGRGEAAGGDGGRRTRPEPRRLRRPPPPRHRPFRRPRHPDDGRGGARLPLVAYAGQDRLYVPTDQLAAVAPLHRGRGAAALPDGRDRLGARRRAGCARRWRPWPRRSSRLHRARARGDRARLPARHPLAAGDGGGLPLRGDPRPAHRHRRRQGATWRTAEPMDRLVFGDVGFGKTEVAVRAAFKARAGRQAGGGAGAHHPARPAAPPDLLRAVRPLPGPGRGAVAASSPPASRQAVVAGLGHRGGRRRHRDPSPALARTSASRTSGCSSSTRSSVSGSPPRTASRRLRVGGRPHPHRHPHPPHPARWRSPASAR